MKTLRFEWDQKKEKVNIRKHGVSFEEARMAFYDANSIQFFDPDHSVEEDYFILLGLSLKLRVLVVCHCFRESETLVRIISARKADSRVRSSRASGRIRIVGRSHRAIGPIGLRTHLTELGNRTLGGSARAIR